MQTLLLCTVDTTAGVEVWVRAQEGELGTAAITPAAARWLLCEGIPPAPGILLVS
jgi:hypothetical protein